MPQDAAADAPKKKTGRAGLRRAQELRAQGRHVEWLVNVLQARGSHHTSPGAKPGQPPHGFLERIMSLEKQVAMLKNLVTDLRPGRAGEEKEQKAYAEEGKTETEVQNEVTQEIDNDKVATIVQSFSAVALAISSGALSEEHRRRVVQAIEQLEPKVQKCIREAHPSIFLVANVSAPAAAAQGHAAADAEQGQEETVRQSSREATEHFYGKAPQMRAEAPEFVPKAEEGAQVTTDGDHQPPTQSASCTAEGAATYH